MPSYSYPSAGSTVSKMQYDSWNNQGGRPYQARFERRRDARLTVDDLKDVSVLFW